MENFITHEEQMDFKNWLGLNLSSISWEGRYLDDFNRVWSILFEDDIEASAQFKILDDLVNVLSQGPILSWVDWLKKKLVCYIFIKKNTSVQNLSQMSQLSVAEISLILRNYFVERFPFMEDQINDVFSVGSPVSEKTKYTFKSISFLLNDNLKLEGSMENEVMRDLEVTLYSDWSVLTDKLVSSQSNSFRIEDTLKDKKFLNRQIKFLWELVILFIVGGMLIFLIKIGNKAYEDYLVKEISLFSPNFFWLDKNLSFKSNEKVKDAELKIRLDELEALEELEAKQVFKDVRDSARYEVESDVVLTSVDTLPKDFEVAGLEQSNYEEVRKGGYRNNRYGRRKAYRVMMTSVNPDLLKTDLLKILEKYGVEQVDNVKPGTKIPGGIYFNLYVPRQSLKEFLSTVSTFEDKATILESKTIFNGPRNMDKVFIWIKSI